MQSLSEKQLNQEQVPAAPKHKQPWYKLAAQILAWQIAAIFVVELALSLAGLGEEEMFKLDPELGFTHMHNKKVTWRSEGYSTSYFNEDGMREPGLTVAKPAGTYRVALLGDSLTESLQVPFEQSYGFQLQEKLSHDLARPVQVLNFGTSGYSTVQEYLQLKKQVLKYKPDLVLLCYNSRDCFENWSPPDEVITNVRPAALHLPGGKLTVVTTPVTGWMKSPRARFLKNVEFLRDRSRLWGLFSAAELDWSMHNEAYKRLILLFTRPGKAIKQTSSDLQTYCKTSWATISKGTSKNSTESSKTVADSTKLSAKTDSSDKTSSNVQTAMSSDKTSSNLKTTVSSNKTSSNDKSIVSSKTNVSNDEQMASKGNIAASSKAAAVDPKATKAPPSIYEQLIVRTLGSLFEEMKKESNNAGAQFSVVALPVRSALSAKSGMETAFNNYDYNDEIKMLNGICADKHIGLINVHESAKSLPAQDKDYLFYLVHLTPKGHDFVAKSLAPAITSSILANGTTLTTQANLSTTSQTNSSPSPSENSQANSSTGATKHSTANSSTGGTEHSTVNSSTRNSTQTKISELFQGNRRGVAMRRPNSIVQPASSESNPSRNLQ